LNFDEFIGIKFTQFRVSNFRQLLGTPSQTAGKVSADDAKGIINAQKLLPHQSGFVFMFYCLSIF
jgi:hypothetical protein